MSPTPAPAERILLELKEVKEAGNCVCGTLLARPCYLCKRIKFWQRRVDQGRALLLKDKEIVRDA